MGEASDGAPQISLCPSTVTRYVREILPTRGAVFWRETPWRRRNTSHDEGSMDSEFLQLHLLDTHYYQIFHHDKAWKHASEAQLCYLVHAPSIVMLWKYCAPAPVNIA
jgi:hypothetical protein